MKRFQTLFLYSFLIFNFCPLFSFSQSISWYNVLKKDSYAMAQEKVAVDSQDNLYILSAKDDYSIILLKTNTHGHTILSDTVKSNQKIKIQDVCIGSGSNLFILHSYLAGYIVSKWDKDFNLLWQKELTESQVKSIFVKDSFIYLGGDKWMGDKKRAAWIAKYNLSGEKIWSKRFDYGDWSWIYINDITVDSLYNIYIAGYESSAIFFAKFDSTGSIIWDKIYKESENHDECWHIKIDKDNNIILYGFVNKPWVGYDNTMWIGKFNNDGEKVFSITGHQSNGYGIKYPSGIVIGNDGAIYTSCCHGGKGFISKYDSSGNQSWSITHNSWKYDCPMSITKDSNDNIYFAGDSSSNLIYGQIVVNNTNVYDQGLYPIYKLTNYNLYQNYPNPFNPSTSIKYNIQKSNHVTLKIYNLTGQEIETLVSEFQSNGEHQIEWQPNGLSSGIYFYRLQAGGFSETKKLIFQK